MAKVIITLGNDISTDDIYPGRFMATVLPTETPQFAFFDRTEFNAFLKARQFPAGSVIVGGENFGCGSSREQACSTLKGYDVTVVAKSIARIFLQNSINLGLTVVICPEIDAKEGDDLEITDDKVINRTSGKTYAQVQMPASRKGIMDAGGLIPYTRKLLKARA
ncbi:MAG: 3-isopropylmalate dehydratase [Gemmatimonadetes bacterium]|nr:3-isopropylmalate dehydratase [Gemmatimonadota bacterium]